jgi:hypothetical protein
MLMSDLTNSGWEIFADGILIGIAYYRNQDQPWFICNFEPTSAFEAYRPNFDELAEFVNNPSRETAHIDPSVFYENKIEVLNLSLQPFGDVWDGEVFIGQIYDANECWIRPL